MFVRNLVFSTFIAFLFLHCVSKQSSAVNEMKQDKSISPKDQSKLSQLKQLLALIQDPQIDSLLKLNLETLENEKANLLENWYSKQQIDTMIEIKQTLSKWKQCPKDKPYYDGSQCVSCKLEGQVFDVVTKKCAICRSGTLYDKNKKTCVSRKSIFNIAITEMDQQTAQEIITIRANKIAGSMMSFIHEKTQGLKSRLKMNDQHEISIGQTPNITNPHFLNLVIFGKGQKASDYQRKYGDVACPQQTPYYSKNHCISCNYPTHLFDSKTQLCVKCSTNYKYSIKDHKCVKITN